MMAVPDPAAAAMPPETSDTETPAGFPALSAIDARILGSLMEKAATTPEAYPLTVNSLVLACNQKTSREPLMALEPGEVGHALRQMEQTRLVRIVDGARAQRYDHRFSATYSVTAGQQALLGLLLLRGPQTVPELLNRSERWHAFAGLDEVRQTLERLMQRSPTLVVNIGRGSGQREDRYMHLLCGPVDVELLQASSASRSASASGERSSLESRVDALESALDALRAELAELKARDAG
jgi:uncharacterized protein YceH (UPF0502 family)